MHDLTIAKRYLSKAQNAEDKGHEFNIPLTTYIRMMKRKHCQYTGLPFSEEKGPLYRTLERKDPSKGYTVDNTLVVCHSINLLKSAADDAQNPLEIKHIARMVKVLTNK